MKKSSILKGLFLLAFTFTIAAMVSCKKEKVTAAPDQVTVNNNLIKKGAWFNESSVDLDANGNVVQTYPPNGNIMTFIDDSEYTINAGTGIGHWWLKDATHLTLTEPIKSGDTHDPTTYQCTYTVTTDKFVLTMDGTHRETYHH